MTDSEIRARDAAQLLENPMFSAVMDQIQQEAVKAWLGTPAQGGQEAREYAWVLAKAVNRIRDVLQGAVDDGTIQAARAARPLSKP